MYILYNVCVLEVIEGCMCFCQLYRKSRMWEIEFKYFWKQTNKQKGIVYRWFWPTISYRKLHTNLKTRQWLDYRSTAFQLLMSKQHQVKNFEVYIWMKEARDCTLQFINYTGITDHTALERTLTLASIWVAEISAVCILSSPWSIGIKQF